MRAANAGDVDGILAVLADDASLLPPGGPMVSGEPAIRPLWAQFVENPGFALDVELHRVEMSRAGDLAYSVGTYEVTVHDANGRPVTERGKGVEIWRKGPDGVWRHVVDIWNPDAPPAPQDR